MKAGGISGCPFILQHVKDCRMLQSPSQARIDMGIAAVRIQAVSLGAFLLLSLNRRKEILVPISA